MEEYKKYTHRGRKGIDDLTSIIPYDGDPNWPVFKPAFDITEEEYKANKKSYEARVNAKNYAYIFDLKESGEYGKEYQIHFNFRNIPEFDQPAPKYNFKMFVPKGFDKDAKTPYFGLKYDQSEEKEE